MFDYAVTATVTRTDPETGSKVTTDLPLFTLIGDVQGITSTEHARKIALAVIDPMRFYDVVSTTILPVCK